MRLVSKAADNGGCEPPQPSLIWGLRPQTPGTLTRATRLLGKAHRPVALRSCDSLARLARSCLIRELRPSLPRRSLGEGGTPCTLTRATRLLGNARRPVALRSCDSLARLARSCLIRELRPSLPRRSLGEGGTPGTLTRATRLLGNARWHVALRSCGSRARLARSCLIRELRPSLPRRSLGEGGTPCTLTRATRLLRKTRRHVALRSCGSLAPGPSAVSNK